MRKFFNNLGKKIGQALWNIRAALFHLVFGIPYNQLVAVCKNQFYLDEQLETQNKRFNELIEITRKELKELEEIVIEVVDMTGGPGWTHTIQQAIMQLDIRIDQLNMAVVQHESNFNAIAEENDKLIQLTNWSMDDKPN